MAGARNPGALDAYDQRVFINCPFDEDYRAMFEAIVFTVHACGLTPRCALEADNAVEPRFEKIVRIIKSCRFGIHVVSRTQLNAEGLPRFNMPLELGPVSWHGQSWRSHPEAESGFGA